MRKFLLLCGALGAVIYVVTVILGGVLRPEYSHVSQPISELVAAGAPNRSLLSLLFLVYNILVGAFGVGLFLNAKASSRGRGLGMAGGLALVSGGLGASAASGSGGSPVFGLVERITIGAFIQWLFVVGLTMYSIVAPETVRRVSPAG